MAKLTGVTDNRPTHEEIARRAYALFEKSGRVPGRDLQNWLEAEVQLKTAQAPIAQSPAGVRMVGKPAPQQQTTANRV